MASIIRKFLKLDNDFIKARSGDIDRFIENNCHVRQYVDFDRIVRIDTNWGKIFPVVAYAKLPLFTKHRNFMHYYSTVLGYYKDRHTGETFFRLDHGHRAYSKAESWFLMPPNYNEKSFKLRYYFWDKYVYLFRKTLFLSKNIVWNLGLDYNCHLFRLNCTRLRKTFVLNSNENLPVVSLLGNVLDSSFVLRNNGKKLVYLSISFFLERIWLNFVDRRRWFCELNVNRIAHAFINQLNFLEVYEKFNWFINYNKCMGMNYNSPITIWNYIYNSIINIKLQTNNFFNNEVFKVLGFKNRMKGVHFMSKNSFLLLSCLNRLSRRTKVFFSRRRKVYNRKRRFNRRKKTKAPLHYYIYLLKSLKRLEKLGLNLCNRLEALLKKENLSLHLRINAFSLYQWAVKRRKRFTLRVLRMSTYKSKRKSRKILYKLLNCNPFKLNVILYKFINRKYLIKRYKHFMKVRKPALWKRRENSYSSNKFIKNIIVKGKSIFAYKNKFKPVMLISRLHRIRMFRRFRIRHRRKSFNSYVKRWRKRKLFYKKHVYGKYKFGWGHLGGLYVFDDVKRTKIWNMNLKRDIKSIGVKYYLNSGLFNSYFKYFKHKRFMVKIIIYLFSIVNFMLRKCVFKLFISSKNDKYLFDIQLLLYRLIIIISNRFILKRKFPKAKRKLKLLNKYCFRSYSSNKYYLI